MSDRCFMQVTCRTKDVAMFEELGFHQTDAFAESYHLVTVIDEEADYAHDGFMPEDIPYFGRHSHGDNYYRMRFACDGTTYREITACDDDRFPVQFDCNSLPFAEELEAVKSFLEFERSVIESLCKPCIVVEAM